MLRLRKTCRCTQRYVPLRHTCAEHNIERCIDLMPWVRCVPTRSTTKGSRECWTARAKIDIFGIALGRRGAAARAGIHRIATRGPFHRVMQARRRVDHDTGGHGTKQEHE